MRVLVDTSVWIDFFRGAETAHTRSLEDCIRERHDLCLCGLVLTEVLQGIREEKDYVRTKRYLERLLYLDSDRSTFDLGATIYRELRRKGITIRNSIDCLIAATVLQHGVRLLEHDRDYQFIDQHYPLNRL